LRNRGNQRNMDLMSEGFSEQYPYRTLGYQLRNLRQKNKQSITDVSGAVEIEQSYLEKIEKGAILPTEDILLLLISHFGLSNEPAMKLWKLAGYDKLSDPDQLDPELLSQQSSVLLLPIDARIIYSDSVNVKKNEYGVTVNFMQSSNQKDDKPLSIARIGMSKEQAKNVVNSLQRVLADQKTKKDSTSAAIDKRQKHKQ
jgi:transcriptional regulator with XRE-family HTH domain